MNERADETSACSAQRGRGTSPAARGHLEWSTAGATAPGASLQLTLTSPAAFDDANSS